MLGQKAPFPLGSFGAQLGTKAPDHPFSGRSTVEGMQVLRECAEAALAAPSIFNTQPWRWQVTNGVLRLWADLERQLLVADPQGRMLTISCGVALHHARVALAAAGHQPRVVRLPDRGSPDLLAEVSVAGPHQPGAAEIRLRDAIVQRRTDRRPFHGGVPAEAISALADAAESQGARLRLIRGHEISALAVAAAQAGALQLADPGYRRELVSWTHRPRWSGDGVPMATVVEPSPRAVPVRNFVLSGSPERGLPPGPHTDVSAQFGVVSTGEDSPLAWIQAGEALSAMLLTATSLGLGTAPMSDITELSVTREQLRQLLGGTGIPQLAVRIGKRPPGSPPPAPRRHPSEVIYS